MENFISCAVYYPSATSTTTTNTTATLPLLLLPFYLQVISNIVSGNTYWERHTKMWSN